MQTQMVSQMKPMEELNVNALKVDMTHYFQTDQIFDSRAHVVKWCQEVGSKIMVVVVTVKSDKPTHRRSGRLILGCERGGVHREHKKKLGQKETVKEIQETRRKKCGCPFTLRGVPFPDDKWKLQVQCGEHNHPVATTWVGHSYVGRLSREEQDKWKLEVQYGEHNHPVATTSVSHSYVGRLSHEEQDKWKLAVQHGEHNHQDSINLFGHSYTGRLNHEEEQAQIGTTKSEVRSNTIFTTIKKENKKNFSSMRASYNTRANIRVKDKGAWSTMQQVQEILSQVNIKVSPQDTELKLQRRKSRLGRKYIEALPQSMKVYISDIHEIKGDGNCGFRAVAELIGLHEEDAWQTVRRDLLVEVINNAQQYIKMFGNELLNEIIYTLMCFDSPCPRENWMSMPYTGYLIASAYKLVFVFLSNQQCVTFLPTRDSPTPGLPHRLISVGYVYDCHYVSVHLKPEAPIPPIASLWQNHHSKAADLWPTIYIERIRVFQELIPPEVVTSDHFEIDD